MNSSKIDYKVSESLRMFENPGIIQPSDGWHDSVMQRFSATHPNSAAPKIRFLVITFMIILINIGFFYNALVNNTDRKVSRYSDLKVISKEFMINPTSLNN